MPNIFISYKRENQPFAESLRERLIAWGFSVWMDVHDIPPGGDWPIEIKRGLRAAHTVIGVMTPLALQSRNVLNEWEWAIVHQKRLLPIMLESCDLPLNLIRLNYIDFTAHRDSGFATLHTALDSPTETSAAPADPFLPYLQALYERVNTMLAHAIIKIDAGDPAPIALVSERTRGAVDELFEKRDSLDPFFASMGIDQSSEWESGDFRAAYDHFDGRVLLLGEPGAGKTITLLHFGRDAVVQRIQNPAAPLPILALIPTWDSRTQPPLADWIAATYGAPSDAKTVIESGRALLLLDGLDELGGEREDRDTKERYDPRERFIEALETLVDPHLTSPMHGGGTAGSGNPAGWKGIQPLPKLWEKLRPLAQEMRNAPTEAENRLWQRLRRRQIHGYKFRRQHAIDRFIVDFYCPDSALIIEVDGPIHQYTEQEDAVRQEWLESLDLRMLRFTNAQIFTEIDGVIEHIAEALLTSKKSSPGEPDSSPMHGGGWEGVKQGNKIIVTCRVRDYHDIGAKIPLSGAVTLQNLSDAQIADYLDELPDLWHALESDDQLREIARTPLLLSFFAFAYRDMTPDDAAKLRDLADSPGGLRDAIFERYVHERYAHEERKLRLRGEVMPFSLAKVYRVLGHVAMENASRGVRPRTAKAFFEKKPIDDTKATFEENILEVGDFKRALKQETISDFINLVVHLHLIRANDVQDFSFIHLLVRDYFAYGYALEHLTDIGFYELNIPFRPRPTPASALGGLRDERAIDPLIGAFKHEKSELHIDALDALGWFKNNKILKIMIDALGNHDDSIRQIASERLQDFDKEAALPLLLEAMQDPNPLLRSEAVMISSAFDGGKQQFKATAALTEDEEGLVRESAVRSLWWLHDPRGAKLVVNALNDTDTKVRAAAAEAIDQWTAELSNDSLEGRIYSTDALEVLMDDKTVDALINALADSNETVRANAATALGTQKNIRAIDALIGALVDTHGSVRENAARALGWLEDERAIDSLVNLTNDDELEVRAAAVFALTKLGGDRIFTLIIRALSDDAERVRASAAYALGHRGDKRAVAHLIPLLSASSDEDIWNAREAAASALVRLGTPEALAAVVPWYVKELFSDFEGRQEKVAETLTKIGTPDAIAGVVPWYIMRLKHEKKWNQKRAADALTEIGTPEAIATAIRWYIQELSNTNPVFGNRSERSCDYAARALTEIGTPETLAAVEAWRAAQDSTDPDAHDDA